MKKLIIFVIIFGVILAIAGFWFWQKNPFSKDALKLEVLGPDKANILDEIEYTVKYKNNSNIGLEEPKLIFEFPQYTLSAETSQGGSSNNFRVRQEISGDDLGDIYPGEEKTMKFKGRLFGQEGEIKTAKVWLSYKPKNLNARYESATTFSTTINSIAISFDFDLSSKVEAGRDFSFSLNYYSNLDYPVSDLGVKIEYPNGFEFISSKPRGLEKTEWDIPILNKADGGRIEINGRLSGDVANQKIFKSTIGVWQDNKFVPLKEITRGVEIVEPHLSIIQRVNGSDNYIANSGDLLHYEIFFRNVSSEPFTNLFMVVKLNGKEFDLDSIKTSNGQASKGDNSIVWDWRNVSKLSFLNQGEEGMAEFWINLKDYQLSSPAEKNAVLNDSVMISQTTENFSVKMNSKLGITQEVKYNDEVFGSSGPNPPRVGSTTTYTITWQLKNYYNDLKNVTVRAILPYNVKLTGKIFPDSEAPKFTFDSQSREIVWRVGDGQPLEAGTGIFNSPPAISFQVALSPDASQIGAKADIIGEATARGEDQWTETNAIGKANAIDTTLPDDRNVSDHSGIVQ